MTLDELLTKKVDAVYQIRSDFLKGDILPKYYKDKLFDLIFEIKYLNDYINCRKLKKRG